MPGAAGDAKLQARAESLARLASGAGWPSCRRRKARSCPARTAARRSRSGSIPPVSGPTQAQALPASEIQMDGRMGWVRPSSLERCFHGAVARSGFSRSSAQPSLPYASFCEKYFHLWGFALIQTAPIRRRAAAAAALVAAIGLALPMPGRRAVRQVGPQSRHGGEPPTLDIQSTPADLVCIIMQHVYEPLYTFDAKSTLVPMLAESHAHDLGRRQDLQHHAAQGRQAAQRPRSQCRRRGGQPEALDGSVAARQVGRRRRWRPDRQGAARRSRSR